MGVKVRGLEATIASLSRKAKYGSLEAEKELSKQAVLIARRARDYAPRKTGALEAADNIVATKPTRQGVVFRRKVEMLGPGRVSEYMEIIHNQIGWQNLGPGSLAKAASGKNVGAFFLTRAAEDMKDSVIIAMRNAIRRGINK